MTHFIISCLSGGWSGTWGFVPYLFLLGKNMHTATMGRPVTGLWPSLGSSGFIDTSQCGLGSLEVVGEKDVCFLFLQKPQVLWLSTDVNQQAPDSKEGN